MEYSAMQAVLIPFIHRMSSCYNSCAGHNIEGTDHGQLILSKALSDFCEGPYLAHTKQDVAQCIDLGGHHCIPNDFLHLCETSDVGCNKESLE